MTLPVSIALNRLMQDFSVDSRRNSISMVSYLAHLSSTVIDGAGYSILLEALAGICSTRAISSGVLSPIIAVNGIQMKPLLSQAPLALETVFLKSGQISISPLHHDDLVQNLSIAQASAVSEEFDQSEEVANNLLSMLEMTQIPIVMKSSHALSSRFSYSISQSQDLPSCYYLIRATPTESTLTLASAVDDYLIPLELQQLMFSVPFDSLGLENLLVSNKYEIEIAQYQLSLRHVSTMHEDIKHHRFDGYECLFEITTAKTGDVTVIDSSNVWLLNRSKEVVMKMMGVRYLSSGHNDSATSMITSQARVSSIIPSPVASRYSREVIREMIEKVLRKNLSQTSTFEDDLVSSKEWSLETLSFSEMGIDSIGMISVMNDLTTIFPSDESLITIDALYQFPTIDSLVDYLSQSQIESEKKETREEITRLAKEANLELVPSPYHLLTSFNQYGPRSAVKLLIFPALGQPAISWLPAIEFFATHEVEAMVVSLPGRFEKQDSPALEEIQDIFPLLVEVRDFSFSIFLKGFS